MITAIILAALTQHSSFHVPAGDAANALHQAGCHTTKTVAVKPFESEQRDKSTWFINGANHEVRCLKWNSVEVTKPTTAHLTWTPPTHREDGEQLPVSDIASYEIHYYKDGDNDMIVVNVSSTELTIELTPGQWHFSIAAIDTNGMSSALSSEVIKTIK